MAKCPLNGFKECIGKECAWSILAGHDSAVSLNNGEPLRVCSMWLIAGNLLSIEQGGLKTNRH